MQTNHNLKSALSRRQMLGGTVFTLLPFIVGTKAGAADELASQYDFLSKNGNSNCTKAFLDSIPTMPKDARLQGSCCSPMELTRYVNQIKGLTKYKTNPDIPPNPYDIEAALAAKLLANYDLPLTSDEQKAYDYAMANSDEKGPCCCRCWRWKAYGGLARLLIRDHHFDGKQVTDVWNISNGCGGG